jgi:hypothetical protein
LLLAAAAAAVGCSQDDRAATQLILVADSDIERLDSVEFRVAAAGAAAQTATAVVAAKGQPAYLTLFREQGPLGPLTVSARGLRGTSTLVTRTHEVWFVEGETLVVPLHLSQMCVGRSCDGETCGELGCTPRALDGESLLPWSGTPPSLADAPAPMTQCEMGMVDLLSDPMHCGGCDRSCALPGALHTRVSCSAGTCGSSCEPLWDNCNGKANDGCEQALAGPQADRNCGACDRRCGSDQRCSDTGVCLQK